jgi:hypothetical protein
MDVNQLVEIGLVKEADIKKVGDHMREMGRRDFLKQAADLLRASRNPDEAIRKLASAQSQEINPALLLEAVIKTAQENPEIVPDEVLEPMVAAAAEAEGGEAGDTGVEITPEDVAEGITQLAQELGVDEETAAQALLEAMAAEEGGAGEGEDLSEADVAAAIDAMPEEAKTAMLTSMVLGQN